LFCNVDNLTSKGLFSISCTSSSLELLDKSPGVYAVAPLTWAPPNIMCSESKLAGPHFLNCTCLHFLPLSGSLNPVHWTTICWKSRKTFLLNSKVQDLKRLTEDAC
jgi:hypothetical protein